MEKPTAKKMVWNGNVSEQSVVSQATLLMSFGSGKDADLKWVLFEVANGKCRDDETNISDSVANERVSLAETRERKREQ